MLGLGVSGSVTFIDLEVTIPETYCPFKTAFEELEIATFIVPVVVGVTVMLFEKVLGSPVIDPSTILIVPLVPAPDIVAVKSTVFTFGTLTVIFTLWPFLGDVGDTLIVVANDFFDSIMMLIKINSIDIFFNVFI